MNIGKHLVHQFRIAILLAVKPYKRPDPFAAADGTTRTDPPKPGDPS
jgi:hypothetical protein